jgi:phage terminase small subunit
MRKIIRAKQAVLEKIGATEFTNVPEVDEKNKRLKQDKVLFEEYCKAMEKQFAVFTDLSANGEIIKTNMNSWERVEIERGTNFKLVE